MALIHSRSGVSIIVDDADYNWLSGYTWHLNNNSGNHRYARTDTGNGFIYMHRLISGPSSGEQVDHVNGNTTDNRRCNLRIASQSQNMANTRRDKSGASSKYRGVSFSRRNGSINPWTAYVNHNNRRAFTKCCATEVEAARARDRAALVIQGEFAVLNFADRRF